MGQQQLLLLVLGIVVVGLAVVTGIEAFGENAQRARYDRQVAYMAEMASRIDTWKNTLPALGGGQGQNRSMSFTDLGLPREPGDEKLLYREGVGCLFVFPVFSSGYNTVRIYDLDACPASRDDLDDDDIAFLMRVYDDHWRFYHMHGDQSSWVRVET
ncbi:MAG: hypothetical protein AAF624_04970 [Bacteroidota bacterium]